MGERLTRAEQRQRTRARLLDAAELLFAERGIRQTSLDQIAAEAGLTKGAIYANFDGKDGLLAAILDRRLADDHPANVGPAPDDASATGWLRHLGESYESVLPLPETRRFALAVIEFWLYSMRTPSAREPMAQWLRTVREANAKDLVDRAGDDLPLPVGQLAVLMSALDIGIAIQHLLDPERVPAELYATGLAAIFGSTGRPG